MHRPVLVEEVLAGLAIKPKGVYVDMTFGRGGHSQKILESLGPEGRLMGLDRDPSAIGVARDQDGLFYNDSRFCIKQACYSQLSEVMQERGWLGSVSGIVMDIGVSSPQLDDPERGFSFQKEGPLDMRMDPSSGTDAQTWLQHADERDIAQVIWRYGEERYARQIARAIVASRDTQAMTTTRQLAELVAGIYSPAARRKSRIHPATRTFQAIRIHINQELQELESALSQVLDVLEVGGRLCVISFHSLEDRIVKKYIAQWADPPESPPHFPVSVAENIRLHRVARLLRSSEEEIQINPRARSAKLRIVEKAA